MTTHTVFDTILLEGNDVAMCVNGEYFLNEERVFVSSEMSALSEIQSKQDSTAEKIKSLIEEDYTFDDIIKSSRIHAASVSADMLAHCTLACGDKRLSNDAIVLEARMQGASIADKYLFVMENGDTVMLGQKELQRLRLFDDELIEHAKQSADNLKQVLKGTY